MLKALKFCQGAINKKDFIAALTHFVIENGRVRSFNGTIALSSPIPFDISCCPKAEMLIKAIDNCDETVQLALTATGRLSIKSGTFKVFIECIKESPYHALPEGEIINFDGKVLLNGLRAVAPFIGNDASRRWANGVLIDKQSLFATNNVMLVQYWIGFCFPNMINIPRDAVKEMMRINEAPIYAQVSENSITFHYGNDRWLRTQLYSTTEWPNLSKILDKNSIQKPINEQLFKGLSVLKSFVDKLGTILFNGNKITTHIDEAEGASFEIEDFQNDGKYNIEMLELLNGTAKTIDWSGYPGPCHFQNDCLRGVIIGLRR